MSSELKLSILSPERRLVEGITVEEVTLPTSEGQIQVLPGHAALVGVLDVGIFYYLSSGKAKVYGTVSGGFFEVRGDEVRVMAETIELKGEIDLDRAKRSQQEAEKTLQEATLDEKHFKEYQLQLQRSLIRQQLAAQQHHE